MIGVLREYAHLRRLFGGLPARLGDELSGRSVVFTMLRGHVKHAWDLEYFFAAFLARLGARVTIVLDDGVFPHLEARQYAPDLPLTREALNPWYSVKGRLQWHVLRYCNRYAYAMSGIELLRTSAFLGHHIADVPERFADAPFAKDAVSSSKRFFQVGRLDLGREDHRRYHNLSLLNAYLSSQVGDYVAEELRPDLVVSSHGIYSTWGPAYDVLRRHAVSVLIYGIHPYVPQTVQLSEQPLQLTDVDEDLVRFMAGEWTAEQRATASTYFAERAGHAAHDTRVYHRDSRAATLRPDLPRPVFGIFPSVIWDGDIEERNRLFPGMYDWVSETIRHFYRRRDRSLVIRFHPSESTLETSSIPLQRLVEVEFPELARQPNIQVIPSDERVDSYDLIRRALDVVLIYDGILGLEAPILGRPTILCARGRFSNLGVGLEPETGAAYFSLLDDAGRVGAAWDGDRRAERALKVLYWYMFEGAYLMPPVARDVVISSVERRPTNLAALQPRDVDPRANPELQRTLGRIVRALSVPEVVH